MVRGKYVKGLVFVSFLLMTNSLNASLTNNVGRNNYSNYINSERSSKSLYGLDRPLFTGLCKSRIPDLKKEYNNKSVNYLYNPQLNIEAKTLPPVPRTLILVLFGFICVSIIKDRKVWLRAISGIIWTGQTSMSFLPYIAYQFISKNQIKGRNTDVYHECCEQEKDWDLQKDTKSIRYIGLLRQLAGIPRNIQDENLNIIYLTKCNLLHNLLCDLFYSSSDNHKNTNSIRSYQLRTSSLFLLLSDINVRSAFKNNRKKLNSRLFIFACLARGPPIYEFEQKLSFKWRVNAQNPSG